MSPIEIQMSPEGGAGGLAPARGFKKASIPAVAGTHGWRKEIRNMFLPFLLTFLPFLSFAQDWGSLATISTTMGVNEGRLCLGESTRGDLGCPTYAPSVSPTGMVTFNAGLTTNAVSLTTVSTTWGYLGNAASYIPNLASNQVSTSVLILNGVSMTSLGGGKLASLTDVSIPSPAPGQYLQFNGTAWRAVSTSDLISGSQVAFSAKNVSQTISGDTKLQFPIKDFDTNNNFDTTTSRFTPTVSGKYLVYAATYCQGYSTSCQLTIRKNGIALRSFSVGGNNEVTKNVQVTHIVDMNGVGDYIEIFVYSIAPTASSSSFSGALINAFGTESNPAAATSADQITSNTLAITANGNTGIISLSTAGSTWGYLAGGASYIPNLTSTKVSATTLKLADNPAEACGPSTYGTIKIINGRQYTCRP